MLAGDALRPSEVAQTLTMRIHKLAGALSNSSHHMQFFFVVRDGLEKSIVQQVMERYPTIECRKHASGDLSEFTKLSPDLSCIPTGTTMFTAKLMVGC